MTDCKTVRIFAYSSTLYARSRTVKQKLKTESETGVSLFFSLASHALRTCEVRALRAREAFTLLLPYSKPILRKNPTVLQSSSVIGRCPLTIRVQIHGWRHRKPQFGALVCSTWRSVLKMFVRFFRIKQVKASKKVIQELFTKKKNGETDTKRVLDDLWMPKLQEIATVAIVCDRYKRLGVLENVFAIILLWARRDVEKLFGESK